MLGLFASVPNVFSINKYISKGSIDNFAFLIQYKLTTTVLITFTVVVCASNYIGRSIECVQNAGAIPQHVLNTYCYFIGTYSVVENQTYFPYYGVGPEPRGDEGKDIHLWYQWVPFYFTFLAVTYYSGHFFWKQLEKNTMKSIRVGMELLKYATCDKKIGDIPSAKEKEESLNILARHIYNRIKGNVNRGWTLPLLLIEVYNAIHAAFAIYLTDVFLGGQGSFVTLTLATAPEVFPTMTKCKFHKYGPSGGIQVHDALCVLAINIVNEKFFYILHWWMPFVLLMCILSLIWRLICMCFFRNAKFNKLVFRENRSGKFDEDDKAEVFQTINFWDWVFLTYLSANMSVRVFKDLFSALAECIRNDTGSDNESNFSKIGTGECNAQDSDNPKAKLISYPRSSTADCESTRPKSISSDEEFFDRVPTKPKEL